MEKFQALNLAVQILAPSHGPVYANSVKRVFDNWASWSKGTYSKKVVVAFGSMYEMTAKCVEPIAEAVKEVGGQAISFNLSEKTLSEVMTDLVDAPILIIGSPTYEHEIFPKVKQFLDMLQVKKFSNRHAAVFGSFSWSGEAGRKLSEQLTAIGFKVANPVVTFFGEPTQQDIEKVKALARSIAQTGFAENSDVLK